MPSPPIAKIAADSNVLLSTIAGRAARLVFAADAPPEVITTARTMEEVREYLPEFAERYDIEAAELEAVLALLPVTVYDETDYSDALMEAQTYLSLRDRDDIHLAALALTFNTPIWSNDRDFDVMPKTKVYTTARLLATLGIRSEK